MDASGVLTSLQKKIMEKVTFVEILTSTGLIPLLYINATVGVNSTDAEVPCF